MPQTETIEIDGHPVAYEAHAGSGPPLVFVHGWCCGRWAFAPQLAHFRAAGRRCIALDLPGHGESGPIDGAITARDLAEALAGVIRATKAAPAIVIGHSMGAVTAFQLAADEPKLVQAVVGVDPAPSFERAENLPGLPEVNEAIHGPDAGEEAFRGLIESFFHPGASPGIREQVLAEMLGAPKETRVRCWEAIYGFDGPSVLPRVRCPVLHVAATPPLNPPHLLAERIEQVVTGWTVGAGHFNQLEVPEQVNAMIERFLATL